MTELRTELRIEAGAELAEILAAELSELCGGVEWRDEGTLLSSQPGRVALLVQLAPETVPEILAAIESCVERAQSAGLNERPQVHERTAHDSEWRDVWKKYFRATRIGRRFVVRPSWDADTDLAADLVIDLDPGRAFGTGAHATTRLVIAACEALANTVQRVDHFLDLGCGSGILSIAAARLWPDARGLAVDVDPEAAACTDENLVRNRVSSVVTRTGRLEDLPAPGLGGAGPFDLVLANIEPAVLCPLAPLLRTHVTPSAYIVLSGILTEVAPTVVAAYTDAGFTLVARNEDEEWTALLCRVSARAKERPTEPPA